MQAYVKSEEATVPNLMATTFAGTYSEMTVEGGFEVVVRSEFEPDPSEDLPVLFWRAVVEFDNTYLPDYDLSAAHRQIEAYEAEVEQLCETAVFPGIRAFGVDGPLTVQFRYYAADRSPIGTLQCSTYH